MRRLLPVMIVLFSVLSARAQGLKFGFVDCSKVARTARIQPFGCPAAQRKAQLQANANRMFHPAGWLGKGNIEGVGFSTCSPDHAIQCCCFWGKFRPIGIGVARGAQGWYACVIYKADGRPNF